MKIGIAADHNGYLLKEFLRRKLQEQGYEVTDFGTNSEEPVDYPDFAGPVAQAIAQHQLDRGILICGTGIGMAIVANRFQGVRAANCCDLFTAALARKDNDANILTLGGRVVAPVLALEIVHTFLETGFDGGRHERRVRKIEQVTQKELIPGNG